MCMPEYSSQKTQKKHFFLIFFHPAGIFAEKGYIKQGNSR